MAQLQEKFGDTTLSRDPKRGRELQSQYDSNKQKLADLEAEYFARENQ